MEQENSFSETFFQQNPNAQQSFQTLPLGEPGMIVEHLSSEDVSNTNLSQLLYTCQFHKALPLLETELNSKRASLGESNVKLVPLLNQMAEVQISLAQYSKASDLSHQSEQILHKHHENPDYSSLITHTYQNMALVSRENQDYQEALDLINKSLVLTSPESLQNIEIHRVKALILSDLRHYKEALKEIQRSLDIVKKLDPIDHILEARVYNALGDIYLALCEWEKANKAFKAALGICKKYGLSSHVEMVKASDGEKYSFCEGDDISRNSGGVSAMRAQEIYDNCFGKETNHPARISSYLTDVRYQRWLEEDHYVRLSVNKAVQEGEAFYGTNSEKMREVRLYAAKVARGLSDIIEDLVKPILETSIEDKTGRELVNLHIQQCHAKVLSGHYESYDSIFLEAVNAIENMCGAVSLEMLKINELTIEFYQKREWKKSAMAYLEWCIEMYKGIFGVNHIEIAKAYIAISKICISEKSFSQAILCLEQALNIQIDCYGEVDLAVSETYFLLADAAESDGAYAKCMKALFKRLRIQEKLGDKAIYDSYEGIGILYGQLKDDENLRSFLRKSYQMKRIELGIDDEWTLQTKNWNRISARCKDLLENNQEKNIV